MNNSRFKAQDSKLMFNIIILFVILASCVFSLEPAFALSINIDPPSLRLTVKPEQSVSGSISVKNAGSSSIKIKAYTEDWVYAKDGSKLFMKPGSSVYSCSGWIRLDPANFELAPKEEKSVNYVLTVPKTASGSHVSVIFFESSTDNKEGISVTGRIGTIVYQDTEGDIKRNWEIKELIVISSEEGEPVNVQLTLANKGNTYLQANAILKILKDGKTVFESKMKPINILPDDSGSSSLTVSEPLKEGGYKAAVEVSYEGKILKSETDFTIKKSSQK